VVRCPIIKIEVRFETHPGGLGNYMKLGRPLADGRFGAKHSGRPY
jgi:hypothetical protein